MNKRAKIVAAAAGGLVILIAYGVIIRSTILEQAERSELEGRIGPLETAVAAERAGADLLPVRQTELAELEADLHEAQLAFPSEVDSTEVLAHVVARAAVNRVNLREVRAQERIRYLEDRERKSQQKIKGLITALEEAHKQIARLTKQLEEHECRINGGSS